MKIISFLALIVFLHGCAAIFAPNTHKIFISSNPSKAQVYVDGKFVGLSPLYTDLEKGENHNVSLILSGYKATIVPFYATPRSTINSKLCALDYTLGWLLLGIPIEIDKIFAPKKCTFFNKDSAYVDMKAGTYSVFNK
jgi:hypothetical protein